MSTKRVVNPKMFRHFARILFRDYNQLLEVPFDGVLAHPSDTNMLEWHFVIEGPAGTPFEGGVYHGELIFDENFPIKRPSIYMITPNGLFICNSNLCSGVGTDLSYKWSPVNSVLSILIGLWLAFKNTDKYLSSFTSAVVLSDAKQRELAQKSRAFNANDKTFCKYFPHFIEDEEDLIKEDRIDEIVIEMPNLEISNP